MKTKRITEMARVQHPFPDPSNFKSTKPQNRQCDPLFRVIDWFRRQVWWGKKKEEKGKTQQQNQHPFHLVVKKRIVQIPFLPSNTNSF